MFVKNKSGDSQNLQRLKKISRNFISRSWQPYSFPWSDCPRSCFPKMIGYKTSMIYTPQSPSPVTCNMAAWLLPVYSIG